MQKQRTMSLRVNENDYNFIKEFSEKQNEEISKFARELMNLGRIMYVIEKYRQGKISIGTAAELAGVSISEILMIFGKFGVKSNIEHEDYLKGLENMRKVW